MNWKFEAIEKLKHYEAKKTALEAIPEEIRRLEQAAVSVRSSTADGTPVRGGGSGREDMLLSNIVSREELRRNLADARAWVRAVEKALAVLSAEERLVLDRFYICPASNNVDRLCGELNCEKTAVYDRRNRALRHFTVALYGITEN